MSKDYKEYEGLSEKVEVPEYTTPDDGAAFCKEEREAALDRHNPEMQVQKKFYKQFAHPKRTEELQKFLNDTNVSYLSSILDDSTIPATHPMVNFMNEFGFMVIPEDDPLTGRYGFCIHNAFTKYHEKQNLSVTRQIHEPPDVRKHQDFEPFIESYLAAVDANHLIIRADCAKGPSVGFIVMCKTPIYHIIRTGDISSVWKPPSQEDIKQQFISQFPKPRDKAEKRMDEMVGLIFEKTQPHGWGGILEFNYPPTEYCVKRNPREEVVSDDASNKRYKIRWMEYITYKRYHEDTVFYTVKEINVQLEDNNLRITNGNDAPIEYRRNKTEGHYPEYRQSGPSYGSVTIVSTDDRKREVTVGTKKSKEK